MPPNDPTDKPFAELLVEAPAREHGGETATNRFGFQHSWAVDLALRLYGTRKDFCILLEVHDDVVALDSSTVPTGGEFYQIKTKKDGDWKVADFCKRRKNDAGKQKPSILGKLYDHFDKFGVGVQRLTLVTNARLNAKLADDSSTTSLEHIRLTALSDTELSATLRKLTSELGLPSTPVGASLICVELTPLSVDGHETHIQGIVSDFLARLGSPILPKPFCQSLCAEVMRRSAKETRASSLGELLRRRGLCRHEIEQMLESAASIQRNDDLMQLIIAQLTEEHYPLAAKRGVVEGARTYLLRRLDKTNTVIGAAERVASAEIARHLKLNTAAHQESLTDCIRRLSAMKASDIQAVQRIYSDSFLHGMFAVLVHEQQLSSPGAESEEEGS